MKRFLQLACALLLPAALLAQPTALEQALFNLPDVIFKKIDTPKGFEAAYELSIRQPVDHQDPGKGYFYQRAYLSHRSFDAPMVIATEGYNVPFNRMYELSDYLDANQVDVEHRYFGASSPSSLDYGYLNLEQATADLHHIRELLGQIYGKAWVSTGISKGGQTTIFYRYFYPDDVAASVPYVAPLNLELKDKRIYAFLDTVGSDACRDAIRQVQLRLLKERDKVMPLLRWYAKGAKESFSYLTMEQAFEYGILEYPFSFWQMGFDCDAIPDAKKDGLEKLLDHFVEVVGLSFFNDETMQGYASHYWQAGTQMGYYGYETDDFKGLLKVLSGEPSAVFMPGKAPMTFEPTLVRKVSEWLQSQGNRFIYIYGGSDTWSATGVPASDKVDAHWYVLPGENHRTARIRNMSEEDQKKLIGELEAWMGE
ncbi:MAG: hypothetical protein KDC66_22855 [Phaeodactylibacter sp.]|nr:hypothetical protein [Phaeodactylibacter sp.]MCB9275562.1 hypothetical protein [Lewinellaceae bacterium]